MRNGTAKNKKSLLNSYGGIMAASSSTSFSRSKTGFGSEMASVGHGVGGFNGAASMTNSSLMMINEDQLDVNLGAGNLSKNATAIP